MNADPDPVVDLKRALRRAIDLHFDSLRAAAKKAGISADTASRAVSEKAPVPSPRTVRAILQACGNPRLDDRRYRDWLDLETRARREERHRSNARSAKRRTRAKVISPAREEYAARSIAPAILLDRADELRALSDFVHNGSGRTYAWWQAEPWSGKSALASWITLNPPQRCLVVTFLVTSQFRGHADSGGFVAAIAESLGRILGRTVAVPASPLEWRKALEDLIRETAAKVAASDRALLIVVDGLEEDEGSGPDSGIPSIAATPHRDRQFRRGIPGIRHQPPPPGSPRRCAGGPPPAQRRALLLRPLATCERRATTGWAGAGSCASTWLDRGRHHRSAGGQRWRVVAVGPESDHSDP